MFTHRWRGCLGLVMVVCLTGATSGRDDVQDVTAVGESISQDGACSDALRKALEQAGRSEISSHSNVENYELIRDMIYARSDGIVTDYRIIEQGDAAGGVKFCKIRARVSKSAIASEWGALQNVLDQVGRPAVAVYILERIDGVVQDSSILEPQIEHRLLEVGFNVLAGEHVRVVMEKESADAESEVNIPKVQALAKDFGAQIFITGTAQANSAGIKELAGEPTAMYNGDAVIKMFYTDTAQLLASESLANWRGGARGVHSVSPQAGKKALENAGHDLVERCYQNVMKRWATQITAGGEIVLEVEGLSVAEAIELKKKLKDIHPSKIKNVNYTLTKGIATYRIKAEMTAEELAEYLVGGEFEALIELVDVKPYRLQAKRVAP
ncbi:MAG: hypothetical protein JSU63_17565 [Phycisphaerales bacterium]|nr:MAG: hypothetical protein JSU63_17565 [Phycisphaerales bacterium]